MDLRDYDPAIGRWTGIDPIEHHQTSPYAAFYNNPVFWADPNGATPNNQWLQGFDGVWHHVDGSNFTTIWDSSNSDNESAASAGEVLEYLDSSLGSGAQVALLPASFDFHKITKNWQAAGVTGLSLTVQSLTRQIASVDFEIEVGLPLKLANGTIISEKLAQIASAEAANDAAATIGTLAEISNGKFYKAPALVQITFAALMQKNLDRAMRKLLDLPSNTFIGSRVNTPIQSNIPTKQAVWQQVSMLEEIGLWMRSWF